MKWNLVFKTRKYFPQEIEGDVGTVEHKVKSYVTLGGRGHDATVEVMTDQINVRVNGRKVAVYMAGA
jgi:hypothetical protein